MASNAHLSLTQPVKSYDFDGLGMYIVDRYELIVADDDVLEILVYLGSGFVESQHGEHYLDCRLRRKLRVMGYFERMFGEPEPFCEHIVWNALHWPWEMGLADQMPRPIMDQRPERDNEPRYTRSRITKTALFIHPVNQMAFKVSKPPRESRWRPCLTGEAVVVVEKSSTRLQAYDYAKKHGHKAHIRKMDGGQIEVRFELNGNGSAKVTQPDGTR